VGFREMIIERERADAARREELWAEARRAGDALRRNGVSRIIVFGSLARGEADRHSDLDLLVVWETSLGRWERLDAVWKAINPRVAVDLMVVTPAELAGLSAFGEQVLREGVDV
jgi:predicted nucleotidyltransferase